MNFVWVLGIETIDVMVVVKDDVKSCRKVASEVYGALCGLLIPKDVVVVRCP